MIYTNFLQRGLHRVPFKLKSLVDVNQSGAVKQAKSSVLGEMLRFPLMFK